MFSHVTLGTNDWQRARPFWIAVMEVLGHPVMFERDGGIAFGEPTGPKTFIGPPFDRQEARPGNGVHVAFVVKDRATVDAFHAAALAHGEPMKACRGRGRTIIGITTAPTCATRTATSCRRSVIRRMGSRGQG